MYVFDCFLVDRKSRVFVEGYGPGWGKGLWILFVSLGFILLFWRPLAYNIAINNLFGSEMVGDLIKSTGNKQNNSDIDQI